MMSEPQTPQQTPSPPPTAADAASPSGEAPRWNVQIDRAGVLAQELSLGRGQVERTLELLDGGATLPFIARYRKEATGGLDEVQIAAIRDRGAYLSELSARKESILGEIHRQGKLTPSLEKRILATLSKTELEDLYLPYKPKRRTRATIAREKGLEPLAQHILAQEGQVTPWPREQLGAAFVSAERGVADVESAFAGARDIVAEVISDMAEVRAALRALAMESGVMRSRKIEQPEEDDTPEPGNEREPGAGLGRGPRPKEKKEDPAAKFSDYFDYEEAVRDIPSHRMLALRRGEKEGFLRVTLELDRDQAIGVVRGRVVKNAGAALRADLNQALEDAWDRLLKPAIEVDVRLALRERADAEAIKVFAENLRHLLLAPVLGGKRVLALDPGYRTGCKLAIMDEKGDFVTHDVLFLTQSEGRKAEAAERLEKLCAQHRIQAIAIGNGTASRETEAFVRKLLTAGRLPGVRVAVVNEAGASVYSASEIARQELPDQDVTVRGAVSIGRRLQDPLAELVKIEPKSIGVGQYQHDVHQPTLKKQLDQVVESCVNLVGVNVNTASPRLLQYVAGVGETLAQNIVAYRSEHGPFRSRRQLLEVPRLGPKAFEQAAGFLRIDGAENPLDGSAVHPESYDVVERMARDLGVDVAGLIGNRELMGRLELGRYVDEKRGEPTLRDILKELEKPGRDPRGDFEEAGFNPEVTEFEHLKEGMLMNGVVTNVTNFGAFVDIGVHQDGLVHVSELSHKFIKEPAEVVKVGDKVKVKVVKVDTERRRIGLSIKAATEPPKAEGGKGREMAAPGPRPQERDRGRPPMDRGKDRRPEPPRGGREARDARDARDDRPRGGGPGKPGAGERPAAGGGAGGGKPFSTPFNQIRIRTKN
jgi:uncharacterized protein